MADITVRPIKPDEIGKVADLLSTEYYNDEFFIWSVPNDDERHKIVADYYKIYLGAAGCVAHVAESPGMGIVGASVWLPHDVDIGMYEEIDKVVGEYAPQFRAVSDRSHDSEPPMEPFYQLVGFGVLSKMRGQSVGTALLMYHLDILDEAGIPTYLEASTPYAGGGVYGRFGYQPVGELMVFADTAVLYPLWRPAVKDTRLLVKDKRVVHFGNYTWRVLDLHDNKVLLLSEKVFTSQKYHDVFENVSWATSSSRKYLNSAFLDTFTPEDQMQIAETKVCSCNNQWFNTCGGADTTDKIFLLSMQELVMYLGDGRQFPYDKFYINDKFNDARRAVDSDNIPSRWALRTPGSMSNFVVYVTIEGKIAITGDFVNRSSSELFKVGIRPALWVNKDAILHANHEVLSCSNCIHPALSSNGSSIPAAIRL